MTLETRDRVVCEAENYFREPEVPHDPVAESATRNHDANDPWARERSAHEPATVVVLQGAGPDVRIEYIDGDDHDEAA